MTVDEVFINGRRYRVPERVIVLDFWDKVSKVPNKAARSVKHEATSLPTFLPKFITRELDITSGMSSPLTSLSSLEDQDEDIPVCAKPPLRDEEDVKVAEVSRSTYNISAFLIYR